ncbi:Uncharacterized protein SCF082_LOCUS4654 [Durusdinium trenchii]|uniref:Dynactin subunit 4 n=1 Tax=Durusdinium trenchii TaxID=1381693 RepID=A0ABP0I0M3_9DINO
MPSSEEQTYHFACSYCRWSSKGRQEAEKPEQLITEIVSLERESQPRQRMMAMLEAFRSKAQEQQREKELAQRLRRRTSARTSFSAASLTAFAARRFSSAATMRSGARLPMSGVSGALSTELKKEGGESGQWNVEDLETKLLEQAARNSDIRSDAYMSQPSPEPPASPEVKDSPKRFSFSGAASQEVPVLAGLSVEEVLRSHREALPSGRCLLDDLQNSIEAGDVQGASASLSMRLAQVSYGYHGVSVNSAAKADLVNGLHKGQSQLETPLQHQNAWKLLPIRKPLLTKRSRRCKLNCKPGMDSGAQDATAAKTCRGLVVKPQINPCANPPFQKNNVAVNFVPRCLPWSCVERNGTYELVLILANPMESDLEIDLNPSAFNATQECAGDWRELLLQQNVEVLTPAFTTTIPKFLDITEATEVFEEETKQLRQRDRADVTTKDVILDRKLNKILVRLQFRKVETETQQGGTPGGPTGPTSWPWRFFMQMILKFSVKFSADESKAHQVEVIFCLRAGDADRTAG